MFHTRVAKAPMMRSSPNLAQCSSDLRNDLCKSWLVSVEGWALCGCTKVTFFPWFQWLALRQASTNVLPWLDEKLKQEAGETWTSITVWNEGTYKSLWMLKESTKTHSCTLLIPIARNWREWNTINDNEMHPSQVNSRDLCPRFYIDVFLLLDKLPSPRLRKNPSAPNGVLWHIGTE